jgi:TolB-like protein/class 3 adenylate cyclase/tetratricopeptide (TPR) repeat protein
MSAHLERRLAAILAADVVGYSRLMERDEAGTFERHKAFRNTVVEPILARHGGRFVDLKGDGAIVEFGSVLAAVEAAVEIQRLMQKQDSELPEPERIRYRIGINLGDVIVDGNTIYGDGVNVAARIESLCEPGGVWLSRSVYNSVRGKLDLVLSPCGLHHVKNISEAVETFRVALDGAAPARRRSSASVLRRPRWVMPVAGGLLAFLLFAAGVWSLWPAEPLHVHRPALAVLPFDNYGGDEATARLAQGITEDVITDLARFRDLDEVARNSTEVYKGKPVDVRQIGRELNVGYVLEGSIQRQADQIRVTAQLIDARNGNHVWSQRWDRPAQDVFAVQTEVAERVAGALGGDMTFGQITRAELQRAKRLQPTDLTAYDYFLLGGMSKATMSNLPQGIEYLTKAVQLDPKLARAYSVRAWLYNFMMFFGGDGPTMIANMVADAERAVEIDPRDAASVATLGYARLMRGRYAEAENLFRSAVEMSSGNSHVLVMAASGFAYLGKAEEGAALSDRALRLDPRMTPGNIGGLKDAYFMARRYEDVIKVSHLIPEEIRTRDVWVFLTASYAWLGRGEEAASAREKLLRAFPTVSAERSLNEDYTFAKQKDEDFFVESHRVADLPLCMTVSEIASIPSAKRRAECEAERAKVSKRGL